MTTEKSLVVEAEDSQHQQQKEEGEGATNSGQQETQLEEASQHPMLQMTQRHSTH